jgi:predicted Zn-dependent protease with MMP-like domain
MDTAQFERDVAAALDSLPEALKPYLSTVEVVVLPEPTRFQRRLMGLRPRDTLYGLYEGIPIPERVAAAAGGGDPSGAVPSVISIFRRSLAADFPDPEELRAEIRRTVLHELAHHFGISDDRLRELDAY